jgi:precorrin-4 methylase
MNMFIWVRLTSGDEIVLNSDHIMSMERAANNEEETVIRMIEKNHSGDFVVYIARREMGSLHKSLLSEKGN